MSVAAVCLNAAQNMQKSDEVSQSIKLNESNFEILNEVLKKLINENRMLKKEIDEVRQSLKEVKALVASNRPNNTQANNLATPMQDKRYFVTAWQLNLREKPMYENSKIIKTVSIGDVIEIDTDFMPTVFDESTWVRTKGGYYLNNKYIKKIEEVNIKTDMSAIVRSKPIGSKDTALNTLNENTFLKAIGELKEWYVLKDGSFIYKGYATKLKG